jgi:23S rRNA pseudouridine2605 synthase
LTAEQLEAARAERMRHNGLGALTLEEARTWIEETGLCLFLPRKQFTTSVAPSFVEAIGGKRDATPDPRQIAAAEDLLVRLENDGVAVRLNLSGQPGEQPDFVVATWVLPYVYALRGDRDWRRNPQLTGSRAVSQLAVQAYKHLEAGDSTISQLKHALGREVSEAAVVRAITELWQQLRIIPTIAAAGQPAKWQLLRHRYQKAIAEGASTSQVTAISVLASIYLQAVIAASMEEVELFLAPLTARSKVREVLRGLVATRQVHTISMGHAPHFYVAGTLPEFAPSAMIYAGTSIVSSYYMNGGDREETRREFTFSQPPAYNAPPASIPLKAQVPEPQAPVAPVHAPAQASKPPAPRTQPAPRTHLSRPTHNRNRKATTSRPGPSSSGSRIFRRSAEARPSASRSSNGSRPGTGAGSRPAAGARWGQNGHTSANGKTNGNSSSKKVAASARSNGTSQRPNGNGAGTRNGKSTTPAWGKHNGHAKSAKTAGKPSGLKRKTALTRKDVRIDARTSRGNRKPALAAGAKAGNSKRFGFTARPNKGTKKRG